MINSKFNLARRTGMEFGHGPRLVLTASSLPIFIPILIPFLHLVLFNFGRGKSDS
jgi:hypothetical protein